MLPALWQLYYPSINMLTHWGWDEINNISKTTFSNVFFFNENVWISIKISLKFVPKGPINNIPALVQIMAWRRLGDKPLSEPMMFSLLTHICVTRPQWVNCVSHVHTCILGVWTLTCKCQTKTWHENRYLFLTIHHVKELTHQGLVMNLCL